MNYVELENLYFRINFQLKNNLIYKNDVICILVLDELAIGPVSNVLQKIENTLNNHYSTEKVKR